MTIKNNDPRLVFCMSSDAIVPSGRFDIPDRSPLELTGVSGVGSIGVTNGTGFNNPIPGLFQTLGNGSGFTSLEGSHFIIIPNSGLETAFLNPRITKDLTICANVTAKGGIYEHKLGTSTQSFNGGVLWTFEKDYTVSPEKCTLYISSNGVPQDITLRFGRTGSITELTVPGALRANVQTPVATVVTNNFAVVYVSGIPQASGSHSTDIRVSDNLIIGGEAIRYGPSYRGTLSGTLVNNVSIFNSRLSDSELYDIGVSGVRQDLLTPLSLTPSYLDTSNLVGYWNFTRTDSILDDSLFDKSPTVGIRGNRRLTIGSSDTVIVPFVFGQSGIYNTSLTAESKIKGDSSWRPAIAISPSSSFSVFIVGEYGARSYISYGTQTSSTRGWEITGDSSPSGKVSFKYSRDGIEAYNSLNSATVLTSGEIFSACATFDGLLQRVDFYVNGERARTAYPVSGISRPNEDIEILARHDTASTYIGLGRNNKISQIAMFDRVLTSGEVRYLNSNGFSPSISIPSTQFFAFDTDEIANPAGQRHIEDGSFAFLKTLGMGLQDALVFDRVTLDLVNQPNAPTFTSKPAAVIFRSEETNIALTNIRFWNSRSSALVTDWSKLEYAVSGVWLPTPLWPSGLNTQIPRQIPSSQNLFRQDGGRVIEYNDDFNVSQYIYMALIFSKNHMLGSRGAGLNNQDLSFSVLYDYYGF